VFFYGWDRQSRLAHQYVRFSPIGESTARLIVLSLAGDVYLLHDAVSSYPIIRLR